MVVSCDAKLPPLKVEKGGRVFFSLWSVRRKFSSGKLNNAPEEAETFNYGGCPRHTTKPFTWNMSRRKRGQRRWSSGVHLLGGVWKANNVLAARKCIMQAISFFFCIETELFAYMYSIRAWEKWNGICFTLCGSTTMQLCVKTQSLQQPLFSFFLFSPGLRLMGTDAELVVPQKLHGPAKLSVCAIIRSSQIRY